MEETIQEQPLSKVEQLLLDKAKEIESRLLDTSLRLMITLQQLEMIIPTLFDHFAATKELPRKTKKRIRKSIAHQVLEARRGVSMTISLLGRTKNKLEDLYENTPILDKMEAINTIDLRIERVLNEVMKEYEDV